MRMNDVRQLGAYIAVSALAVGTAFALSLKFIGSLRAQDEGPPPAGIEAPEQPGFEDQTQERATPSSSSGLAELEGFLEPFIYDVANRRDPFLAFAEFIPTEEGPLRALTPAQRYALEELRLVGVMWEVKDPKAMFMDPDEEVLVLGRDESIGNRNGYIAAIREGEVVVVEAIRKRGDIIYRTRVLRIER